MKKLELLFLSSIFLIFSLNVGYTQQSTVIEKVKERLKSFKTVDKKSTAIAGVRGAEEKEEETLFWFGKDMVTKDELDLFKAALDKAESGDKTTARQNFQSFLNKYPKSALAPDAYEILKTLNQ
ncbi:MAG: hypothetical protein OHK0040_06830 [bacterium]